MAQHVSAGVFTKISDFSEYVQNVPSTIGFIPIVSEYGIDNELIFTNARDFYIDFGEPNIQYGGKLFGQGKYVCDSFLKQSDALYVIRVCPDNAAFSNIVLWGETADYYGDDSTANIVVTSVSGLNTEAEIKDICDFEESGAVKDGTSAAAVVICGVGRGAWYDNFKIKVSAHANTIRGSEGVYVLDIYERQTSLDYDSSTGQWVEDFQIAATFEISFNPDKVDDSQESMFIEDVVNSYYKKLKVYADRDFCRELCLAGADWSEAFTDDGGIRLDNGDDGGIFDTNDSTNYATALLAKAYQGRLKRVRVLSEDFNINDSTQYVDEVLNTDDYYFNIILDGGYPSDVKTQIAELALNRGDSLAILDNGDNKTIDEALSARLMTHTYNDWHTAIYECYSKVYDIYNGRDIWLTPVYHMAGVIPYTDNVTELWYAPAGFNRATLPNIKSLRFSPRLDDRDRMHLAQLNPIVKFNVGYTVWSQLTSQKRPTALQEINIARLVLYIQRALQQYCKYYIFEQNDDITWASIQSNIDKFLKTLQDQRGLYGYGVEVGASEYEIKAGKIHVNVSLNPVRTIKQIDLNFFIY